MSRTDKDRPWQIRAADSTEHCRKGNRAYFRHNEYDHSRYGSCHDGCGWTLPYIVLSQPPRDYVRAVWFGPERARERVGLLALRKERNTYYNVNVEDFHEEDFHNKQHRHQAHRLWC